VRVLSILAKDKCVAEDLIRAVGNDDSASNSDESRGSQLVRSILKSLVECGMVQTVVGPGSRLFRTTDMGLAVLHKIRTGCRMESSNNCIELVRQVPGHRDGLIVVCRWWTGPMGRRRFPQPVFAPERLLTDWKVRQTCEETEREAVWGNTLADGIGRLSVAQGHRPSGSRPPKPVPRTTDKPIGRSSASRNSHASSRFPHTGKLQRLDRETRFEEGFADGAFESTRKRVGIRLTGRLGDL
jgi:hypothetical protein